MTGRSGRIALVLALLAVACSSDDDESVPTWGAVDGAAGAAGSMTLDGGQWPDATRDGELADAASEASGPCPADMVLVEDFCVDRYEAPNVVGEVPLIMYTFVEAEAWCQSRDKRLCFDDEWTTSCAGTALTKYPYGDTHQPGVCNDDETWLLYDQGKLNGWPLSGSTPEVTTLAELLSQVGAVSASAQAAADHVQWLYQGEAAGENLGCVGDAQVFDLVGNVEEWTRRRDGGTTDFHGSLKGRYWAESRTCQSAVTTHGDQFRFYEIGFRCCRDAG